MTNLLGCDEKLKPSTASSTTFFDRVQGLGMPADLLTAALTLENVTGSNLQKSYVSFIITDFFDHP
jgi:hypothetical protein